MNLPPFLRLSAVAVGCFAAALSSSAVQVGDSLAAVQSELGPSMGELKRGDQWLLLYERGEIELVAGRVVRVNLISAEAAEARTRERQLAIERRQSEARERAEARRREGEAELARALEDRSLAAQPAQAQLAFWDNFQVRFPEIALPESIVAKRREWVRTETARLEEIRERQRLDELEARVAAAEQRAAAAEEQARLARLRSRSSYSSHTTTVIRDYFPSSSVVVVTQPRRDDCPPGFVSPRHRGFNTKVPPTRHSFVSRPPVVCPPETFRDHRQPRRHPSPAVSRPEGHTPAPLAPITLAPPAPPAPRDLPSILSKRALPPVGNKPFPHVRSQP